MNITYTNEILDSYSGQTNLEAGIYVDDEIVGVVQYVLFDGELTVSNIFIRPEFRRQGFGSRLMKYIKKENPDFKYKPSMKTEDGGLFKHKDISLKENKKAMFVNEAIGDFLKPKNPDEIRSAIKDMVEPSNFRIILKTLPSLAEYLNTKTFSKKLSQDDDWHKEYKDLTVLKDGEWASTKDGKRKYWITKPLLDVTEITKKIILNSIEILNSPPKKLKILHIEQSIEAPFIRLMYKLNAVKGGIKRIQGNNNIFDFIYKGNDYVYLGDTTGVAIFIIPENFVEKLYNVQESIGEVLSPKSKNDVIDIIKSRHVIPEIEKELQSFPYLEDFLENFNFERTFYLWQNDAYQSIDVTDRAKEIIIKNSKKIRTPKKLRALQFNMGGRTPILNFLLDINRLNEKKLKDLGDNDVFKWIYSGSDYAFFANSNGFALYVLPENFIKNFYINESIGNILKPKSKEDIRNSVIELLANANPTNVVKLIDEIQPTGREEPSTIKELQKIASIMKSKFSDLYFITSKENDWQSFLTVFYSINEQMKKLLPHTLNVLTYYQHPMSNDNPMTYTINAFSKMALGSQIYGVDVIIYDNSVFMEIVDKYLKFI